MTVKHLQSVQRQQLHVAIQTDPNVIHKFKTGFVECAEEVARYINQLEGIDAIVRQGLLNHLNKCAISLDQIGSLTNFNNGYCANISSVFGSGTMTNTFAASTITAPTSTVFPSLPQDHNNNKCNTSEKTIQMGGIHLIPSRLPSGELALIVPNGNSSNVLNCDANNRSTFAVWPPSLVQVSTHMPNVTISHKTSAPPVAEFTANIQQNISAFTKPISLVQQEQQVPHPPPPVQSKSHKKHSTNIITPKTKIFQPKQHHNFATTSPPLSPISSISSHGDESSIMHTSSDYVLSRPATPRLDISLADKQNFSGVFSTPPSSADSSLTSSHSSINLQQQQVTSTSGRNLNNSLKRFHNVSTDSADSSDDPSAKKLLIRNEISTDDEGSCWRPW